MKLEVGAILRRREPAGDAYDELRVVGSFDLGEGGWEAVLSPLDFGETFSADVGAALRDYEIQSEAAPAEPWTAQPEGVRG